MQQRVRKNQIKFDVYSYIAGANPREADSFLVDKGYSVPQNIHERIICLRDYANKYKEKALHEIANKIHPDKELILNAKKEDIQEYANACGCSVAFDGESEKPTTKSVEKYIEGTATQTTSTDNNRFSISRDTATLIGVFIITGLSVALAVKNYKH